MHWALSPASGIGSRLAEMPIASWWGYNLFSTDTPSSRASTDPALPSKGTYPTSKLGGAHSTQDRNRDCLPHGGAVQRPS